MQHIAVLDFGSQYTHLIARRVRELGALAKIYPPDIIAVDLPADVCGIILSGGPQSVYDQEALTMDEAILKLSKPILGLCYGHQLLAHLLDGEVKPGTVREYGRAKFCHSRDLPAEASAQAGSGNPLKLSPLFKNIPLSSTVWMSHGDTVADLPDGFEVIGSTDDCPVAAMADERRKIYGLQFHPEVHHTARGREILKNFVFNVCRAEPNWRIDNLLDDIINKIQKQAGDKKVFLMVSGGVDSTVCFALLKKALGKERVFGLHIDTGFMRQDESKEIAAMLARAGYDNLHVKDASKTFYDRLREVCDPEQKRKIIGQAFLDVKDEAAAELKLNPDEWLLAQGTIYPDTIETGGARHADRIKTHHNRVDAIRELIAAGKIIEPLADFYKDEVRALGGLLGLPPELINRHPFPGPGLAIRVLCSDSPPRRPVPRSLLSPEALTKGDGEGGGGVRGGASGFNHPFSPPWKGGDLNCQLLPIKSVGVQGDNRTYAHPAAIWSYSPPARPVRRSLLSPEALVPLRSKTAEDGAKGDGEGGGGGWRGWEWDKLDDISRQITNANRDINRVLLLLNPPQDISYSNLRDSGRPGLNGLDFWIPALPSPPKRLRRLDAGMTESRVELLRAIDAMVTEEIKAAGVYDALWQCPVVLIPLGRDNKESIVLRPVVSQEAMTANFARLPKNLIDKITSRILATGKISYIFYDITNKPPGTIEWE